jgi:hypothetical protein
MILPSSRCPLLFSEITNRYPLKLPNIAWWPPSVYAPEHQEHLLELLRSIVAAVLADSRQCRLHEVFVIEDVFIINLDGLLIDYIYTILFRINGELSIGIGRVMIWDQVRKVLLSRFVNHAG